MNFQEVLTKYKQTKTEKEKNELLKLFQQEDIKNLIEEYICLEQENLLLFGRLNNLNMLVEKTHLNLTTLINQPIKEKDC